MVLNKSLNAQRNGEDYDIYVCLYLLDILQLLWLVLWMGRIQETKEKSKIQSS